MDLAQIDCLAVKKAADIICQKIPGISQINTGVEQGIANLTANDEN